MKGSIFFTLLHVIYLSTSWLGTKGIFIYWSNALDITPPPPIYSQDNITHTFPDLRFEQEIIVQLVNVQLNISGDMGCRITKRN